MAEPALRSEHESRMRDWERSAPWLRRVSMRFGLQRKLIICFIALLTAAMGVTCFVFNEEMHDRLGDITGEQATQVATALSLTSQAAISGSDWEELDHRAQELLAKSRNIIYIAYLDAAEHPKVYATRDVQFALSDLTFGQQALMRVRRRTSPTFGEYVEVDAPILSSPPPEAREHYEGPHLLGYVEVGISQMREQSQIQSIQYVLLGIACVMVLIGFPVVSLLVHRIFLPIRKLVSVTKQLTAGNLDARAEIHRPDDIGDLARSFDEMAVALKQHQHALAQANEQLAEANRHLEQ